MDLWFVLQDLESLSEGLEGRSNNPVALLFDTLLRPNTDMDKTYPSSLRWEYDPAKAVPHIVVGREDPGGCWQFMDPAVKTLSLDRWLELPLYSFREWKLDRGGRNGHVTRVDNHGRVLCGELAHYYSDYVTKMGLERNFMGHSEISQIDQANRFDTCTLLDMSPSPTNHSPLCSSPPSSSSSSSLLSPASPSSICSRNETTVPMAVEKLTRLCSSLSSEPEDCGIVCSQRAPKQMWHLKGSQNSPITGTPEADIHIVSQRLVLACGVYGNPRHLGAPGEQEVGFLTYRLPDFSKRISSCAAAGTVLVVGAGLSAADAVFLALQSGVRVVHVFEQDPKDQKLIFSRMSKEVYQGYKYVHRLMMGQEVTPSYVCRAQYRVTQFQCNSVAITTADDCHEELWDGVELGGVFIGCNAELSFLPEKLVAKLGSTCGREVNAKHNPVAVDPISFVTEASSSLYAVGSLVGDNFVRFGVGSALGAAQHIIRS